MRLISVNVIMVKYMCKRKEINTFADATVLHNSIFPMAPNKQIERFLFTLNAH